MIKETLTGAAVVVLLAMPVAAVAQNIPHDSPTSHAAQSQSNAAKQHGASATNPSGSDQIKPDQIRSTKLVGSSVYDKDNVKIGDVEDLVLDKDGKVADVVLDIGGFLGMGGKNVAVQFGDLKFDNNRVTISKAKDELQNAAEYQLKDKGTGAGKGPSPVHGGQGQSSTGEK